MLTCTHYTYKNIKKKLYFIKKQKKQKKLNIFLMKNIKCYKIKKKTKQQKLNILLMKNI